MVNSSSTPPPPNRISSDLDLRIAGTRDAILMVECGAKEVPEAVMVDALNFGHQSIQPLIDVQEQMAREIGKPKQTLRILHPGRSCPDPGQ